MASKKLGEADGHSPHPAHSAPQDSIADRVRPLYVLPMFANFFIVASVSALCGLIGEEIYEESQFPLPHWVFFASAVVFAPTMIAVCKVLPDPSHSLCVGGLLSTTGLLWTALVSGHQQMFIFGVLVGTGVTLSFTSACISLAPYFVQRRKHGALWMLVGVAIIAVSVRSIVGNLLAVLGSKTFVSLCPITFITSFVPYATRVWLARKSRPDNQKSCSSRDDVMLMDVESATSGGLVGAKTCEDTAGEVTDSVCHCIKQRFRSMTFQDGWLVSIISVIVWLFWGAGVDSTWHCMLLSPSLDASWLAIFSASSMGQNIILIQLLLSMAVLLIKVMTEPRSASHSSSSSSSSASSSPLLSSSSASSPLLSSSSFHAYSQPKDRLVFGCNYMFLGFLGVGGLLLSLCPDHTIPFHNHLIFSMGFALQFDDLCDLKAEDDDDVDDDAEDGDVGNVGSGGIINQIPLKNSTRVIHGITLKQIEKLEPKKSNLDLCCLLCHLLSLFMMSCLAMLLGLQISHGIIYVLTMSPFAYLFSSGGLVFVSTVSIVLALAQPDTWLSRGQCPDARRCLSHDTCHVTRRDNNNTHHHETPSCSWSRIDGDKK